jgi:L-fucose dehydrogenase
VDLGLKDKVTLITGGAKGIGAAIARTIAEEGAIPVIIDRDQDAAEKLHADLRQCHGYSDLVVAEMNTAEACCAAVEQTLKKLGRIDALVNNAGVNDSVGLEKGRPDQFVASLQRNLLHYALCSATFEADWRIHCQHQFEDSGHGPGRDFWLCGFEGRNPRHDS